MKKCEKCNIISIITYRDICYYCYNCLFIKKK